MLSYFVPAMFVAELISTKSMLLDQPRQCQNTNTVDRSSLVGRQARITALTIAIARKDEELSAGEVMQFALGEGLAFAALGERHDPFTDQLRRNIRNLPSKKTGVSVG